MSTKKTKGSQPPSENADNQEIAEQIGVPPTDSRPAEDGEEVTHDEETTVEQVAQESGEPVRVRRTIRRTVRRRSTSEDVVEDVTETVPWAPDTDAYPAPVG